MKKSRVSQLLGLMVSPSINRIEFFSSALNVIRVINNALRFAKNTSATLLCIVVGFFMRSEGGRRARSHTFAHGQLWYYSLMIGGKCKLCSATQNVFLNIHFVTQVHLSTHNALGLVHARADATKQGRKLGREATILNTRQC